MCANRLNWLGDLSSGQAGVGQNERNPCFRDRFSVGDGVGFIGDFPEIFGDDGGVSLTFTVQYRHRCAD
jgi:hypothetical protein